MITGCQNGIHSPTPQLHLHAKPQRHPNSNEEDEGVWPQHWGVTKEQCKEFIRVCKSDENWSSSFTMRDLVEYYVKPLTVGTGAGFALLRNAARPLEVNVMVSHAWGENAEEFFEAAARSVRCHDVMFICALALYQNEDGAGPSIAEQLGSSAEESPFRRVLDHIKERRLANKGAHDRKNLTRKLAHILLILGVFLFFFPMGAANCIPMINGECAVGDYHIKDAHNFSAIPNCWLPRWHFKFISIPLKIQFCMPTAFLLFAISLSLRLVWTTRPLYRGFMVAVPNRQCDLYSRLWCVYEMFVACKLGVPVKLGKTLASAGTCRCSDASCSSDADTSRIRGEIAQWEDELVAKRPKAYTRKTLTFTKNAAEIIDSEIRRVTWRARWAMIAWASWWFMPYVVLKIAILFFDFGITPAVMFHSNICDGFFPLMFAALLILGIACWLAAKAQGVVSIRTIRFYCLSIILLSIALHFCDVIITKFVVTDVANLLLEYPAPFHHCFTMVMLSNGVTLWILAEFALLLRGRLKHPVKATIALIAVASVGMLVLVQAVLDPEPGQLMLCVFWYFFFRFGPCFATSVLCVSFAQIWGVKIVRSTYSGDEKENIVWETISSSTCSNAKEGDDEDAISSADESSQFDQQGLGSRRTISEEIC